MLADRYFPTIVRSNNGYPTTDHRPMAETDLHRKLMFLVIDTLIARYAGNPDVYVTGNLLLFYDRGNKRKHVAPDCFVVFGVPNYDRPNFLLWDEQRGPGVVIELTSKTTKKEDMEGKFALYRDVLKVPEYFLFDPTKDYLTPIMQGYRLVDGEYREIERVADRLPSEQLKLHLEQDGQILRFWDPAVDAWIPTPPERLYLEHSLRLRAEEIAEAERAARIEMEIACRASEANAEAERVARFESETKAEAERVARVAAESELERLRREVDELRNRNGR